LGLLTVQMLFGLSYSTFLLLPKFLRLELHATATQIGRVSGAATIVAAVVAPFIGALTRRLSRKGVLALALGAESLSALGFCWVDEVTPIMFVLRAFQGAAWVLLFNVTATWAADLVPEHKMAKAIGYIGSAMLITNAVAPGVAEPLAMRFGYKPTFALASLLVGVAMFPLWRLRDPLVTAVPVSREQETTSPLLAPRVLAVNYGSLLLGAGIGSMFTYIQPYAIELGARVVGVFFFGYVGAAIFVRTVLADLSDRAGPAKVAVASLVLYALTVGSSAFLQAEWLVVYGVGLGVSHGLAYPSLTAAGFSAVGKLLRTKFMSWYTAAFNLGFALTVLTLGPIVDAWGYPVLFVSVGLLIGTGAAALYATNSQSKA
jgi:predicted MFS family arabinose efflux permease